LHHKNKYKIQAMQECTGKSVLPTLRNLQVGETATFSVDKLFSVRTTCYSSGFQWGKKFTTRTNRKNRTVTVKRVK